MIRNLKVLGLALVAVLALSAMAASAASAVEFHSEAEETTLKATNTTNHVFDAASNSISCSSASFHGTQKGKTAEDVTMTAAYNGCQFFGVTVNVNMGNCAYTFHASGTTDVVNNGAASCATSPITFKATVFGLSCTVKVGPQTGLEKVIYTNGTSGGVKDVTVDSEITTANGHTITYTQEGSLCGSHNEGQYTAPSAATVKGFALPGEAATGIWVE